MLFMILLYKVFETQVTLNYPSETVIVIRFAIAVLNIDAGKSNREVDLTLLKLQL